MIFETQEQLNESLAYWQKVLRVQDYDITAVLVSSVDMSGPDRLGEVARMSTQQSAKIRLLRSDEHRTVFANGHEPVGSYCHETALVHELIHVKMSLFEPEDMDSMEWTLCERFVEDTARSYVALKRQALP